MLSRPVFKFIHKAIHVDYRGDDDPELQRLVHGANILHVLLICVSVFLFFEAFVIDYKTNIIIAAFIFFSSLFCFIWLNKTKNNFIPSYILLIWLSLLVVFRVSIGVNLSYIWLLVFPFIFFMTCGLKIGLIFLLTQISLIVTVFFIIDDSPLIYSYPFEVKVRVFVAYLFSTCLAISSEFIHRHSQQKINDLIDELELLSLTDSLTGLYNRRFFNSRIDHEIKRSQRTGREFSIISCDIDHFKSVNDTYGHSVGDTVLKEVADILRSNFRSSDTVTRFGGEEFLILLPETNKPEALTKAEIIRQTVESYIFDHDGFKLSITISFGVHWSNGSDELETILKIADEKLYKAKNSGRNQVCCYD